MLASTKATVVCFSSRGCGLCSHCKKFAQKEGFEFYHSIADFLNLIGQIGAGGQ